MTSRPIHLVLLCALAAAPLGCGANEGGVVGSGISAATVSGNVVEVEGDLAAALAAAVPSLRVSIEEAEGISDVTEEDGVFELTGEFAGPVTVRFESRTGRLLARLGIDVPAGSTVVLEDLEIRPSLPGGARPREIRQRDLFGRVVSVGCRGGGFVLDDDVSRPFRITLVPETEIVRRDGTPAVCEDLARGQVVLVEGRVLAAMDGFAIIAQRVTLGPLRPSPPGRR
jgi:hypothetical protein